MGLAGIGLNLLMGYAGLVSLGSAAFMSIGAFATYNLLLRAPWLPLPLTLVAAGLITGVVGVLPTSESMKAWRCPMNAALSAAVATLSPRAFAKSGRNRPTNPGPSTISEPLIFAM